MEHSPKILAGILSGETATSARLRIEGDLASLPELSGRWFELRSMDHETVEFVQEFETFFGHFFHLWSLSSPMTIEALGITECFSILEVAWTWKNLVWRTEKLELYEQLPKRVNIFRGAKGPVTNVLKGYSWSFSKDFAETFASHPDGILVGATVDRDDILMFGDFEMEVIPRLNSPGEIKQIAR